MSKTRYSATFTLPDGTEHTITRGSQHDYGYTWAWVLLAGVGEQGAGSGDRVEQGAVIGKGFSRMRKNAEQAAQSGLKYGQGRIALYAPVTKGGAS